jgi:hypothetical protein
MLLPCVGVQVCGSLSDCAGEKLAAGSFPPVQTRQPDFLPVL